MHHMFVIRATIEGCSSAAREEERPLGQCEEAVQCLMRHGRDARRRQLREHCQEMLRAPLLILIFSSAVHIRGRFTGMPSLAFMTAAAAPDAVAGSIRRVRPGATGMVDNQAANFVVCFKFFRLRDSSAGRLTR